MRIEDVTAYEQVDSSEIKEINSHARLLRHKKTGARVVLIENDDENKVFYIGFRTPPRESTGVMHILEHSVLCGSKEFPVKDPFIELAKGSLNTFLNAMTYPDKTVYPVASCNDKDFQNLMHVYLDAVFYPNIYNHDMTFRQEGWHYEMESAEDELTINGVVYNEMKGAFSSPDDVLEREIFNTLFPDTPYSEESGGDPKVIPELTYEHYLDIHRQYYHPSNSYIYLYGNMDMAEKLQFIDEHYLSAFERLEIDSQIPMQKAFDKPIEVNKYFSVTESEPLEDNTYLSYNCVTNDCLDRKKYIAFQVLDYALCGTPGAVLKQALLDAGIGKDIYSFYDNGIRQPYFSVVAKNAEGSKKEEFISLIRKVLTEITKKGFDKDTLRAGLNYYEFKYREADFGSYPPGLMYGLQILDSWLYDEHKPFIHLAAEDTFASLREDIETDYYEQLLKEALLDNTHCSIVVVEPKRNLVEQEEKQLKEKLAAYKASLSKEEIETIVKNTAQLLEYQETEDTPEALACIPVLEREDIKKESAPLYNEERRVEDKVCLYHPVFTNGINYVRVMFTTKNVPKEYLPYIGILKSVLCYVATEKYSYSELFNQIYLSTGGITPVTNVYTNALNTDEVTVSFEWKMKTLPGKLPEGFALVEEIMLRSDLTDRKRLQEILGELKSRMQSNMISAGHHVASGRAASYFSKSGAIQEAITGMPCYQLVCRMEKDMEKNAQELTDTLIKVCRFLFTVDKLMFDFAGEEKEYQVFEKLASDLSQKLPKDEESSVFDTLVPEKKNEGLLSASQVQYVCRAGNFTKSGLSYTGALRVLKVMMGYDYLWNQVRVKGGAYGCMCSFSKSGESYFVSYRDPNLKKTIEVYEAAADYVASFEQDDRSMTQYIIGAISELDTPLNAPAKALRSLSAYMTNQTEKDLQQVRDELLATNQETIRLLAGHIRAFMEQDYLCVVGNEEKVKEEAGLFGEVRDLYAE